MAMVVVKIMPTEVAVLDFWSVKNLESLFIPPKGNKQSHFNA
jgi:hypothetical protein